MIESKIITGQQQQQQHSSGFWLYCCVLLAGIFFWNRLYRPSTGTMSKCVIKANDMTPQMSKFATKVGIEALQAAQTEQVRVTLAFSTLFPRCFFFWSLLASNTTRLPAPFFCSVVLLFFVRQTRNLVALTLLFFNTFTVNEWRFWDHAGSSIHY